jgi:hypothetical protein
MRERLLWREVTLSIARKTATSIVTDVLTLIPQNIPPRTCDPLGGHGLLRGRTVVLLDFAVHDLGLSLNPVESRHELLREWHPAQAPAAYPSSGVDVLMLPVDGQHEEACQRSRCS